MAKKDNSNEITVISNDWLKNYSKNQSYYQESLKRLTESLKNVKIDYNSLLGNLPKSASISKRQSLKNISNAYQNEKMVLVLGAGISLEFGVPSWNLLLQNLMVHTIEKENNVSNVLSKLFNDIFTPNPLIAGRYLQEYFENNNSSFESMVREVLYSKIDKDKNSDLLNEIVKICVAPGKSPNLDSIITYNFDDILEYKLDQTGLEVPYKSVYGLGIEIKNGELPIYHVHGYLPEDKKLTDSNKITFGESNYHQQYSDLYSWNNMVQINKFRENTCVFIGSSLTDPNIRRLLDIALKQKGNKRKHHYIFKKKIDDKQLSEKLKKILESPEIINNKNNAGLDFDETIKLLTDIYERFEENDSASFGVQTIWIDDWNEIPEILTKIRENVA
ncbi:SIR2 family protein [Sabulilitoribacter arenilitoris]|uniref:SIR2 family protein n=1 Tax=Wocania arenilitoris TaxID=2044858 RepID=A0AAE3EQ85_9FLAO|nr:SIR2 family protein [Wocania arenilitoris]MCF7569668.1 SIR2 family protein [Wocania arenilitoris]